MKYKHYKQHRNTNACAPSEHDEQTVFMTWLMFQYPTLFELTTAVPNGGRRHLGTAVKLKKEGVKAGVPDILCFYKKNGYTGLAIEMKSKYNKESKEQAKWLNNLSDQGWFCAVCWSAKDAMQAVEDYLKGGIE